MTRLLKHPILMLLIGILVVILSGCSGYKAKVAFYTFFFYLIFIPTCMPAIILAASARGNGSKGAKVTGIVFASIGSFFGLIYTLNCIEDFSNGMMSDEILLYLLILWGALIGAWIMLLIPNPKLKAKQSNLRFEQPYQQTPRKEHTYASDATIVEEVHGESEPEEKPESNMEKANNTEQREMTDDDIDMSGLEGL